MAATVRGSQYAGMESGEPFPGTRDADGEGICLGNEESLISHAKLIRRTTCANGSKCDYTVCGDNRDPYVKEHPEYVDEHGYRRNR